MDAGTQEQLSVELKIEKLEQDLKSALKQVAEKDAMIQQLRIKITAMDAQKSQLNDCFEHLVEKLVERL